MKTALKYLTIAGLAVAALTWPLFEVNSTEEEEESTNKDEFKVSEVNATAEERAQDAEEGVAGRQAFRRMQLQDENGEIPPDAWMEAYQAKEAMPFLPEAWNEFTAYGAEVPNPWFSIGPGNIGGRIRSILFHPRDPDTMWVGGVSGGVWKTTNGGLTSWSTNTDLMENLAVTCMAMDPTDPDNIILYAGTGGDIGYPDAVQGKGIFKSTDGGGHWTRLASTNNPNFQYVNRLAVCPANPQILLAATDFGIFRSTDGGDNWSQSTGYGNIRHWVDVRFRPGSGGPGEQPSLIDCLASSDSGHIYYSTDNGATWERNAANGVPSGLARIELAYSRSHPWVVYASKSVVDNAHPSLLLYSENGGYTFTSLGHPQDPDNPNLAGANSYTNVLWVDPTDPDTVVVGGVYILRTKDRGVHWEEAGSNSHLDQHIIVEHPLYTGASGNNKVAFCGSDGGIHRTENILLTTTPRPPGGSLRWDSRNKALGVTQFYGGAANAITGKIIGGTQDNGTVRYEGNAEDWHVLKGALSGDGGFCAADQVSQSEEPFYYGEAQNLQIYRSTDNAQSKHYIIDGPNGIPRPLACGGVPCALFVAPFVLDPNNRARILAGTRSLWRTDNAREEDPLEVDWAEIKAPIVSDSPISAIAVAAADPDLIWVGYVDGSVFYTTNGTAGPSPSPTPSWTSGDPGNVLPHRMCTRITIGPAPLINDPQIAVHRTVYVTFGGFTESNVWKSESNGQSQTWTPIHNNLPKLPVFSLVISPSNPDILYVGTELGVFASSDGGAHWSPANGGPANTQVVELFWMGPKLVAVTHGRGMFFLPPSPQ